jgi:hypothetical protein
MQRLDDGRDAIHLQSKKTHAKETHTKKSSISSSPKNDAAKIVNKTNPKNRG